jgi:MFS family permease
VSAGAIVGREASWAERAATTAAFLASGLGIGAWAASIPTFKSALALSNGALSLALLGFAVGAVLMMQLAGLVAHRLGAAQATRLAMLLFAAALLLPPLAPSLKLLVAGAMAVGAGQGLLDVVMNTQASLVERAWGAPIMSSFHAAFSFGGLAGAALGGALAGAGVGRGMDVAALGVLGLAGAAWAGLRRRGAPMPPRRRLRLPERALLGLCAAALLCMLCEGAMGDWSAVYLATVAGAGPGHAAFGYAAFSAAMVAGRLLGDRVVRGLGRARVVAAGALIAAGGLALAVAVPIPLAATLGFALVGIGLSNVVPAIYSSAGRRGATPAAGVAMAATAGYSGFLVGPVVIGATAQSVGLRAAMVLLVVCAGTVALLARAMRSGS